MSGKIIQTENAPAAIGPYSRSLQNIEAVLTQAGFEKTDVIKTVVFIRNMADFPAVNALYAAFFGDHKPARSCVEVSRLPKDGLIEIEAVAQRIKGNSSR